MKIKRIGVDIAKNVFHVHGVDCQGSRVRSGTSGGTHSEFIEATVKNAKEHTTTTIAKAQRLMANRFNQPWKTPDV